MPPPPRHPVVRSRLVERLDSVVSTRLLTLTGPAGSGKTAVAGQWCRDRAAVPVAWVTATGSDVGHLADRVADAIGNIGAAAERTSPPDDRVALDRLRAVAADTRQCVVVVDLGPHVPSEREIIDVFSTLEDTPACGVHILGIGRAPLSRELAAMWLDGRVEHIGADDLVLDIGEVADVVGAYAGVELATDVAADLTTRLDGWMAGAVFVGLARFPRPADAQTMVAAAWDAIESYLLGQVVNHLPEDLRAFLVETACVSEITAELADTITGRHDGRQLLRSARAAGLPVVHDRPALRLIAPLRTVLDDIAAIIEPAERVKRLQLAVEWYRAREMAVEVAECYLRLGDWESVIDSVLVNVKSIIEHQQFDRVAAIASRAPANLIAGKNYRPISLAALLLWDGRIAAMHDLLHAYQGSLSPVWKAMADLLRSGATSWAGDQGPPIAAAGRALETFETLLDEDPQRPVRDGIDVIAMAVLARASLLLARAYNGDWRSGRDQLVDLPAEIDRRLLQVHQLRVRGARATFLAFAGEADGAVAEARTAWAAAAQIGRTRHQMMGDACWALAEGLRLRAEFDEADTPLALARDLAMGNGRRNLIAAAVSTRAHLLLDLHRVDEASAVLASHVVADHRLPVTVAGHLAAAKARVALAASAPRRALDALADVTPTSMTAAVAVAAQLMLGELGAARQIVADWPIEDIVASHVRRALSAAAVDEAAASPRAARTRLLDAMALAAPRRLVQPFAESAHLVRRLVRPTDARDERMRAFVDAVFVRIGVAAPQTDALSTREIEVLALLERGLSVPAIAKQLFLSPNTVKFHVKAIYRKLGVGSRDEAVRVWGGTA
ncbi:LuxR C-terminal-related transcriptional regulator [Desertimonas flava]|uniref:LuxR C-terminal-related transcriptional regulator n=1 Tax=Desertimonas flava TaxID=2064846 RepID=UPI000E3468A1|nr:LuxR C-terminal-related transcriptional regulator [Desertimonas flava]